MNMFQLAVVIHGSRVIQNDEDIARLKLDDRFGFNVKSIAAEDSSEKDRHVVVICKDTDRRNVLAAWYEGLGRGVPVSEFYIDVFAGNRTAEHGIRLHELPSATVEDMQALQYDVVSLQARELLKIFLPCLPDGEIKQRLERWHCNYSPESYEASLFQQLYRNVLLEIFGQASAD